MSDKKEAAPGGDPGAAVTLQESAAKVPDEHSASACAECNGRLEWSQGLLFCPRCGRIAARDGRMAPPAQPPPRYEGTSCPICGRQTCTIWVSFTRHVLEHAR